MQGNAYQGSHSLSAAKLNGGSLAVTALGGTAGSSGESQLLVPHPLGGGTVETPWINISQRGCRVPERGAGHRCLRGSGTRQV